MVGFSVRGSSGSAIAFTGAESPRSWRWRGGTGAGKSEPTWDGGTHIAGFDHS
jgi:hypothetical protein